MPIGPQVPGVVTTVTPDTTPIRYASTQGPAPDGLVVADDILAVHLMALNIQDHTLSHIPGGLASSARFTELGAACAINGVGSGFAADWGRSYANTMLPAWQQLEARKAMLVVPISTIMPPGSKLDYVSMNITPNTGHGGNLPEFLPIIKLLESLYSFSTFTVLGETVDSSDPLLYENPHDVTALFAPITIDPIKQYWIGIIGENGTNAFANLTLNSARVRIIP